MKNNLLTVFILIVLLYGNALAQRSYPKHQLGLSLNTIVGSGLEYQVELTKDFALSTRAFIYYQGEDPPDVKDQSINFGFDLQYNFLNERRKRLYSFIGASYWQMESRNIREVTVGEINETQRVKNFDYLRNLGLGVGYEYKLSPSIAFDIKLGFHYQSGGEISFAELIDRTHGENQFFGLGGGISLRYIFH